MSEDLNVKLLLKEQALELAEKEVVLIKSQIEHIKGMLSMKPSIFEIEMQSSQKIEVTKVEEPLNLFAHVKAEVEEIAVQKPAKQKGLLTKIILEVLSDGIVRDGHEIFSDVSKQTETTLRSTQATLSNLKKENKIQSAGYGKYQSMKDESPTIGVVGDSIL